MTLRPGVELRPAAQRALTTTDWLRSRHSFSFGAHFDPTNTHHGLLLVNNEDTVAPGSRFETHTHRDMEIVTWVLQGTLVHEDSAGNSGVISAGLAQRMSAGTGILHSERNGSAELDEPVHFVQMWVQPDGFGRPPGYEQREIDLLGGALVPVASGRGGHEGAVRIGNRHAALHVARLASGSQVYIPDTRYVHVFVAGGEVELEGSGTLGTGDAARLTGIGGQRVTASAPAEVLVWEMHACVTD
jgi:redox-sensitive bicupin YhaK (pirin superfamily)